MHALNARSPISSQVSHERWAQNGATPGTSSSGCKEQKYIHGYFSTDL